MSNESETEVSLETERFGWRKLFIGVMHTVMSMETITIAKEEYEKLKKKADIADDALVQLKLSIEDIRHKRVSKFDLKAS